MTSERSQPGGEQELSGPQRQSLSRVGKVGEVGKWAKVLDTKINKPLAVAWERIWQVAWRGILLPYPLLCCCNKSKQVVVGEFILA